MQSGNAPPPQWQQAHRNTLSPTIMISLSLMSYLPLPLPNVQSQACLFHLCKVKTSFSLSPKCSMTIVADKGTTNPHSHHLPCEFTRAPAIWLILLVLLTPQLMNTRKWRTTSCSFPPAKLQPVCNFKSFLLSGLQVTVSQSSSVQKGPKYTQSGTGIFPTAGLYFTSIFEPISTLLLPSAEPTTFLQNILSQFSSAASKL